MKLIRFVNCVAIGLMTNNLVLPSQLTNRWSGQLKYLGGEAKVTYCRSSWALNNLGYLLTHDAYCFRVSPTINLKSKARSIHEVEETTYIIQYCKVCVLKSGKNARGSNQR